MLSDVEIVSLWSAVDCLDPIRAALVKVLLLTGQRRNEVSEMRWIEVDLDKRLWTIAAPRMKGAIEHLVPLSGAVVDILKSLPRRGEFVFTGNGRSAVGNFGHVKMQLDVALPPEMPDWAFHDLRRTMRTGLSMLHVSDVVSELVIAHAQRGLHKVYDRHAYLDEKRLALTAWAGHVVSLVTPRQSNVVRVRARR